MINVQRCVPEIYYNESRDFQVLARAFEVLFNYLKTNVDVIEGFPLSKNFDNSLLTLLAYTVGFISKHNYNANDLFKVCANFAKLLQYKGSITSIELAINTLLNAQQIKKRAQLERDESDRYHFIINLPYEITDLVLLEDIFDYILPAGFTYSFVFSEFIDKVPDVKLVSENETHVYEYTDNKKLAGIAKGVDENFDYDVNPNTPKTITQVNTGVIAK